MRLYPRSGATVIVHAGDQYDAGADDGFDLPGHVADFLGAFPDWETETDRNVRENTAEQSRKRDPAAHYDEVAALRTEVEGLRADMRALRDDLGGTPRRPAKPARGTP